MKLKKIKLLKDNYTKIIEPYKEEALQELCNLVEIDSVHDESTVTKLTPFGKGVEKALEYVAKLGKKLGFNVNRCDNYITELTIFHFIYIITVIIMYPKIFKKTLYY